MSAEHSQQPDPVPAPGPQEIERKWLLRDADGTASVAGAEGQQLEQGYLLFDGAGGEVRLRRSGDADLVLAVKKGHGLVRTEIETTLDESSFVALWPATEGCRVSKVRYRVALPHGLVAEVDEYLGPLQGLWTVEVEFTETQAAASFVAPDWFGVEVTGDPTYSNRVMAQQGLP